MRKFNLNVLFAVLGLLAAIVVVVSSSTGITKVSPELTELAFRPAAPPTRSRRPRGWRPLPARRPARGRETPCQPFLARLLNESDNPGVRAAAMRGLASIWDYDCMPKMLDLVEDPVLQVRDTAAQSVARLIDVRFDASASPEARAEGGQGTAREMEAIPSRDVERSGNAAWAR